MPVPEGLVSSQGEILAKAVREHKRRFFAAMDDDFNSGGAIGVLFGLVRDLNQYFATAPAGVLDKPLLEEARQLLQDSDTILGLFPDGLAAAGGGTESAVPAEVLAKAEERDQARLVKDWARAYALRDEIQDLGYILEDGPAGSRIQRAGS